MMSEGGDVGEHFGGEGGGWESDGLAEVGKEVEGEGEDRGEMTEERCEADRLDVDGEEVENETEYEIEVLETVGEGVESINHHIQKVVEW